MSEEIDPQDWQPSAAKQLFRPGLFIAVILISIWVIEDWRPQLEYLISSSDPIDLGAVTELIDDKGELHLPHNRFVSLEGVTIRKSVSTNYEFYKFVGADIYLQVPNSNSEEGDGQKETSSGKEPFRTSSSRQYFEGAGRLVHFDRMGSEYQGVRDYYARQYKTIFCSDLSRGGSVSARLRQKFGKTKSCTKGYLFQAETPPSDFSWYGLGTIGFVVLIGLNIYWLLQALGRRFRK